MTVCSRVLLALALALGLPLVLAPLSARARGSCTDGVDCLCDKPAIAGNSKVVYCEDFEHVTLYENVFADGYGPWWYDDRAGWRAHGSYWTKNYISASRGCLIPSGFPANPKLGVSCSAGGAPCFHHEYTSRAQAALALGPGATNAWDVNAISCIDILRAGDFNDEVQGLPDPTIPGGGSGVFDGRQTFAHRIGAGQTSGIKGSVSFSPALTTFGVTMAVAYPTNSQASGIWNHPWKHNEWTTVAGSPQGREGIFLFHNSPPLKDSDPFQHFWSNRSGFGQSDCQSRLNQASVNRGEVICSNSNLLVRAAPWQDHYVRSRDWPMGQYACVRGYFENMGGTSKIQIWHNQTLIIDVQGLRTDFLKAYQGFSEFKFNSYANANQGLGETPTNQTTYRYEDNIVVVRDQLPVSCADIGMGTGGGNNTPPPDDGAPARPSILF